MVVQKRGVADWCFYFLFREKDQTDLMKRDLVVNNGAAD